MSQSSMKQVLNGTWKPTPRWTHALSAEDTALLDALEEHVCNVMGTEDTAENRLAREVYRVLHWVSAPDCRKNHPGWGGAPGRGGTEAALSAAAVEA